MPSIKQYDLTYIEIAHTIAKLSKAGRLKVGSVIVDGNNIVAYGYNGMPYGSDNMCEIISGDKTISKPEVVHGELNALIKLIGKNVGSELTMYSTDSPCLSCAIHIFQSKVVKRIVYDREYRLKDGIDFLIEKSITVERLSNLYGNI